MMYGDEDEAVMCGWTIYVHPLDFPEHYVVRMWVVHEGQVIMHGLGILCQSLEQAREQIPQGTICVPRAEVDDPVIAETWL